MYQAFFFHCKHCFGLYVHGNKFFNFYKISVYIFPLHSVFHQRLRVKTIITPASDDNVFAIPNSAVFNTKYPIRHSFLMMSAICKLQINTCIHHGPVVVISEREGGKGMGDTLDWVSIRLYLYDFRFGLCTAFMIYPFMMYITLVCWLASTWRASNKKYITMYMNM